MFTYIYIYQAYVHRAKAYLKNCNLDEAEKDLKYAISKKGDNEEYNELVRSNL